MAISKAALIAEFQTQFPKFFQVPTGSADGTELVETVGNVKKYLYHHLETGLSEKNGKPVAHKRFYVFYVWDEGGAGEDCWYEKDQPENDVQKNLIAVNPSNPTALEVYNVYSSQFMRQRVIGLMIKAAQDIYNESASTENHTQRLRWAIDVMSILSTSSENVGTMMSFIATDSGVLGGTATDSDIKNIINGNIDKWAVIVY